MVLRRSTATATATSRRSRVASDSPQPTADTTLKRLRIFLTCWVLANEKSACFPLASFSFNGSNTVTPRWSSSVITLSTTGVREMAMCWACWTRGMGSPFKNLIRFSWMRRLAPSQNSANQWLAKRRDAWAWANVCSSAVTGAAMTEARFGRSSLMRCSTWISSKSLLVAARAM